MQNSNMNLKFSNINLYYSLILETITEFRHLFEIFMMNENPGLKNVMSGANAELGSFNAI